MVDNTGVVQYPFALCVSGSLFTPNSRKKGTLKNKGPTQESRAGYFRCYQVRVEGLGNDSE